MQSLYLIISFIYLSQHTIAGWSSNMQTTAKIELLSYRNVKGMMQNDHYCETWHFFKDDCDPQVELLVYNKGKKHIFQTKAFSNVKFISDMGEFNMKVDIPTQLIFDIKIFDIDSHRKEIILEKNNVLSIGKNKVEILFFYNKYSSIKIRVTLSNIHRTYMPIVAKQRNLPRRTRFGNVPTLHPRWRIGIRKENDIYRWGNRLNQYSSRKIIQRQYATTPVLKIRRSNRNFGWKNRWNYNYKLTSYPILRRRYTSTPVSISSWNSKFITTPIWKRSYTSIPTLNKERQMAISRHHVRNFRMSSITGREKENKKQTEKPNPKVFSKANRLQLKHRGETSGLKSKILTNSLFFGIIIIMMSILIILVLFLIVIVWMKNRQKTLLISTVINDSSSERNTPMKTTTKKIKKMKIPIAKSISMTIFIENSN